MGKSSINGPFSMAMLNNQRVTLDGPLILMVPTMVPVVFVGPCKGAGCWAMGVGASREVITGDIQQLPGLVMTNSLLLKMPRRNS
mgnify:CR=1 FL=1